MIKKLNKKNQKGFTLVELLVVIAIIGILAVVAVPSLFSQIEKSKAADITATIDTIKTASTAYYADKEDAPKNIDELVSSKYLDSNPNKEEKVNYEITSITPVSTPQGTATSKTAKLTVTITPGYMTAGSIEKLGKDIGVKIIGDTFDITLIDHVKSN